MDETANGVREQLVQWFARDIAHTGKSPSEVADAILARFEVTPKPVVGYLELGMMVSESWKLAQEQGTLGLGREMAGVLERAGLTIVRSGEAAR